MKDVLVGRQQVGDAARHLLLAGGQLVHALPYRGHAGRHRLELQQSGESAAGAVGAITLGAVCARGAACGANQPSCGYEFAIICLAASP